MEKEGKKEEEKELKRISLFLKQMDRIERKVNNIEDIASERKFIAKTKIIHLFFTGLIAALFYSAVFLHLYFGSPENLPEGLCMFGILTGVFYLIFLWILGKGTGTEIGEL